MENVMKYKEVNVNTADRVKIVSMLYDGAINYLRVAKKKMEENDMAGKGYYLGRVTAIIGELSAALNMDAGEIAHNMRRLYDFILQRLLYANLKNDISAFEDAEKILEVLRGAWKEMEKKISNEKDYVVDKNIKSTNMEIRI